MSFVAVDCHFISVSGRLWGSTTAGDTVSTLNTLQSTQLMNHLKASLGKINNLQIVQS